MIRKDALKEQEIWITNGVCLKAGCVSQAMGSLATPSRSRDRKMLQGTRPLPSGDPNQTPSRVEQKALVEMGHPLTRELHFKPQDLPESPTFHWRWDDARQVTVCAAFSCVKTFFFHSLP